MNPSWLMDSLQCQAKASYWLEDLPDAGKSAIPLVFGQCRMKPWQEEDPAGRKSSSAQVHKQHRLFSDVNDTGI